LRQTLLKKWFFLKLFSENFSLPFHGLLESQTGLKMVEVRGGGEPFLKFITPQREGSSLPRIHVFQTFAIPSISHILPL
jgi:hypothetical protein